MTENEPDEPDVLDQLAAALPEQRRGDAYRWVWAASVGTTAVRSRRTTGVAGVEPPDRLAVDQDRLAVVGLEPGDHDAVPQLEAHKSRACRSAICSLVRSAREQAATARSVASAAL